MVCSSVVRVVYVQKKPCIREVLQRGKTSVQNIVTRTGHEKSVGPKAAPSNEKHLSWRTVHPVGASKRRSEAGKDVATMHSHFDGFSWRPVVQASREPFEDRLRGFVSAADGGVAEEKKAAMSHDLPRRLRGGPGQRARAHCTPPLLGIFSGPNITKLSLVLHKSQYLATPSATRRTSRRQQDLSIWLDAFFQVHGQEARSFAVAVAPKPPPDGVDNGLTAEPNCDGWRLRVTSLGTVASKAFAGKGGEGQ